MRIVLAALALVLAPSFALAAIRPAVAVRATTAAIVVSGGADGVSAKLYDSSGSEIDGLVVQRDATRSTVVLVASVKPGARIEVRVPTACDLRVDASNGGPVTIRDVHGQLEIVNSNAAIVLERVAGTVLAATSNGSITASLVSVEPALPMSFLTSNGSIDLTLPADVRANLRLESDTGPITTEYTLSSIAAAPVERKIMRGGRMRTVMSGAVNGGGPEIELRTENSSIVVRRRNSR